MWNKSCFDIAYLSHNFNTDDTIKIDFKQLIILVFILDIASNPYLYLIYTYRSYFNLNWWLKYNIFCIIVSNYDEGDSCRIVLTWFVMIDTKKFDN